MRCEKKRGAGRPEPLRQAGFTWVMTCLLFLGGCAGQPGNLKQAAKSQVPSEQQGALIVQLTDGRRGFRINEPSELSSAGRKDFETAVRMLNEKAYDKAIDLLQKVIAQSPGVSAPYIDLGIAYQRTGKTEQAEKQFKAALKLIPGHPVACNQYGLLLRNSGRFEEAHQIYEQALEQFPDYYPLHRNLGILCDLYLNNLESALRHYKAYLMAKPGDEKVEMWIADLNLRLGKK